jgi:hypothetical protein
MWKASSPRSRGIPTSANTCCKKPLSRFGEREGPAAKRWEGEGTLDDPDSLPPAAHIQTADRIAWMKDINALPEFERFPGS